MASRTAKTNKTYAVMRLIAGGKTAANPILDSNFKEERITSKSKENTVKPIENSVEIDVTGELVTELLPKVLDRFNCCMCVLCYADAMAEALEKVPPLKIKVSEKEDVERANKMKNQSREEVLAILVKIAIGRKRLPKHGENQ